MPDPKISIVLPVFNEEESLPILYDELTAVLGEVGEPYELIFVDDGSTDGSASYCRDLASRDNSVTLVELRRRFGKATGFQAGFKFAAGDIIITMDADLQDNPHDIPQFLEALEAGYDVVSGWKAHRKDPLSKTVPSKFFNFITSRVSGLRLRDFNCGYKAYRREAVQDLDIYGDLYRYIAVVVHAKGFRVGEIPVTHRARKFGKSKFGIERFVRGPLDLLTALFLTTFRKRPLHLFGPIGVTVGFVGFLIDLYLALLWFSGESISDRPLLLLGTLLIIVGIQILIFGLLGEMITATGHRPDEVDPLIRRVTRKT